MFGCGVLVVVFLELFGVSLVFRFSKLLCRAGLVVIYFKKEMVYLGFKMSKMRGYK